MADTTDKTKLPAKANKELGVSGTYIYSGFISGEEYNADLSGKNALRTFDIMRKSDPTVHAALTAIKNPLVGANWEIEPASDDVKDIEAADMATRELFDSDVSWYDFIREALNCLDYGHSIFEIVNSAKVHNGRPYIGLSKLASRKQSSILKWETNETKKPGITQLTAAAGTVSIPREKLVYIINEREGDNYAGISLLRYAYKPWKIKDSLEIMNAIALERMAIGIPIVKKGTDGGTINEQELIKLRNYMRDLRANEEAYLEAPAGIVIEMLDMKAQTTKDILPTIQHMDSQITLSVLAQFLLLGQGGSSGSRAVSSDHSDLFIKSLESVARTIQQAVQTDIINRLINLNYSDLPNGYPKLVFSGISDDDISGFSEAVSKLVTAGALTPDPDVENRLRKMVSLPGLSDEMYKNYAEAKTAKNNTLPVKDIDEKDDTKTESSIIKEAKAIQQKLIAHILED